MIIAPAARTRIGLSPYPNKILPKISSGRSLIPQISRPIFLGRLSPS